MKRFAIFSVLFPVLVFLVFAAPHMARGEFVPIVAVPALLNFAFFLSIVPAWLTALADWALSRTPMYVRLVGTTVAGAVIAELAALLIYDLSDLLGSELINFSALTIRS
ncbi:MAG: hypothetical protein K2Z80_30080 [Xanthobacteraceae bacterium]|nr:hypothetical protein [Xanthobacteraceae bacterium]